MFGLSRDVRFRPVGRNFQRGVRRHASRVAHLAAGGLGALSDPRSPGLLFGAKFESWTNPEKCHRFNSFSFLFLVAFPVLRFLFAIHRLLYWRQMGISYNIWSGKRIFKYGWKFLAKFTIVRLEFEKKFDLICLSMVFVDPLTVPACSHVQ